MGRSCGVLKRNPKLKQFLQYQVYAKYPLIPRSSTSKKKQTKTHQKCTFYDTLQIWQIYSASDAAPCQGFKKGSHFWQFYGISYPLNAGNTGIVFHLLLWIGTLLLLFKAQTFLILYGIFIHCLRSQHRSEWVWLSPCSPNGQVTASKRNS